MRNPRRAYNRDGSEIQPATVGGELAHDTHLAEIWCNACVRSVVVPIDDLPPDLPIPDIALRYRCSVCGGKNIMSRMSIEEKYEVHDARFRGTTPAKAG